MSSSIDPAELQRRCAKAEREAAAERAEADALRAELDRVLAAQLRMRFAMFPNVEIIEADILDVDLVELLGRHAGLGRDDPRRRADR